LIVGAWYTGSIRYNCSIYYWTEQLSTLGKLEGFEAAAKGIEENPSGSF
jgi:hypothetical protein